mmetsp:Transcript_12346/g.37079  ORF Transcript_12346/g.37079 Transcript_12346/m.37079 type:complete len:252 (+) Transcript_12346:641-1396(+)
MRQTPELSGVFVRQVQALEHLRRGAADELIKDVEVALVVRRLDDARLLKQIVRDYAALRHAGSDLEAELEVLPEAAAVVVAPGLCVAEGLKQRVGLKEHGLHLVDAPRRARRGRAHGRDVRLDLLRRLRLARARLPGDDDALVLLLVEHLAVGVLRDHEDVRRGVAADLALEALHELVLVDVHPLEGVHHDEHRPYVRIKHVFSQPLPQVAQDALLSDVAEEDHVRLANFPGHALHAPPGLGHCGVRNAWS